MGNVAKLESVDPNELVFYENNSKKHGPEQIRKLKDSIQHFGFLTPVLIDEKKNIIAGHGRVMAAKELGLETVPCVFVEQISNEERKAYILADNRLGELGEWDFDLVSSELKDLSREGFDISLTGFDIDDIIIDDDMGFQEEPEDVEEIEASEPRVKPGDIWQLGDHRLMCGDSTSREQVQELMDGRKADLLLTDPPYNIDYEGAAGSIENDNMTDAAFDEFLLASFKAAAESMNGGAAFYIWHADSNGLAFRKAVKDAGLLLKQNLIWVKNALNIGRQDYQWRHEPCLYGWKEGAPHYFIDVRSFSTVMDDINELSREEAIKRLKEISDATTILYADKPHYNEEHPTMKPIGLIRKLIRNSSREGDIVLDLFGGSGTTLLAAEEQGRVCYMMEYDPHFCDVIIKRFEDGTGTKAEKIKSR